MYQFLLNKNVIVGVAVAALIGFHFWKVGSLQSDLDDMTNKYNTLSAVTTIQNEEVVRWRNLGEQYGLLLADANKRNQEESKRWAGIVEKIRKEKVPVDCDGATAHLRDAAKTIAREWKK